jgi:hypothetical protein
MNTSKMGSILATTIIWLLVGVDRSGAITDVKKAKYISEQHCLIQKQLAEEKQEPGKNYSKKYYQCLPKKWDGNEY